MMADKENLPGHFIRLSPTTSTRMKSLPNRIAFKIFSPSTGSVGGQSSKQERSGSSSAPGKASHGVQKNKRKSLATLQPSATGRGKVVGTHRIGDSLPEQKKSTTHERKEVCLKQPKLPPSPHEDKVDVTISPCSSPKTEKDPDEQLSSDSEQEADDHTTLVRDAISLVHYKPSPLDYWKELAEQRRMALEEALEENENLFDQVESLKQKLDTALSEASYFKMVYNKLYEEQEGNRLAENKGTSR